MFEYVLSKINLKEGRHLALTKHSGVRRIFSTPDYLKIGKDQTSINVRPILFFLIHQTHLKYFLSIVDILEENKIGYSIVTLNNHFEQQLRPYKKKLIYFSSYYKRSDIWKACFLEFIQYAKYCFLSEKEKAAACLKLYKDYYLMVTALKNITKDHEVKIICMYKGDGFHAQNMGIFIKNSKISTKVIVMQHGLVRSTPQFKDLPIDEFWVFGRFSCLALSSLKVDYELKVVGDPTTDPLFKKRPYLPRKVDKKVRFLFAPNHGNSHTPKSQVVASLSWVLNYAEENPEMYITIKPHPGDINNIVLKNLGNSLKNRNLEILQKNDKLSLDKYDIIILNNSAVGIEAALNRKPVIVLAENEGQIMVKEYLSYGFAEAAFKFHELVEKIDIIRERYTSYQEKTVAFTNDMFENQGEAKITIFKELSKYTK